MRGTRAREATSTLPDPERRPSYVPGKAHRIWAMAALRRGVGTVPFDRGLLDLAEGVAGGAMSVDDLIEHVRATADTDE